MVKHVYILFQREIYCFKIQMETIIYTVQFFTPKWFRVLILKPLHQFPYSRKTGIKVQWTEKGSAVLFLSCVKKWEENQSQEWELWSKPNKTWTNKCCMAKANALLLVAWPRHKWGQRRSCVPINKAHKPIPPSFAFPFWQRAPIFQV